MCYIFNYVGMEKSAMQKSSRFMQFKYSTLENATDNFSEVNKLGIGGYGEVYKVYLTFKLRFNFVGLMRFRMLIITCLLLICYYIYIVVKLQ